MFDFNTIVKIYYVKFFTNIKIIHKNKNEIHKNNNFTKIEPWVKNLDRPLVMNLNVYYIQILLRYEKGKYFKKIHGKRKQFLEIVK